MKKPYNTLKKLLGLPIYEICRLFGVPRITASQTDAGTAGPELEIMTEWMVEAVEALPRPERKKLLARLRHMAKLHGAKGAICITTLNAVWLMPKHEAARFIKKITEGK